MAHLERCGFYFCLLSLLSCVRPSVGVRWRSCGPASAPVKVLNVTLLPDPAVAGKDMTVELPAFSDKEVSGGWVYVSVFFHNIPVHLERDNLCVKTPCPVPAGKFLFQNKQDLPDVTPPGEYKLMLLARDKQRRTLFCAKVDFTIVKGDGVDAENEALLSEVAIKDKEAFRKRILSEGSYRWDHPALAA